MNATILLVDVASASRDSWKSFLQSHNYEVFTAGAPSFSLIWFCCMILCRMFAASTSVAAS